MADERVGPVPAHGELLQVEARAGPRTAEARFRKEECAVVPAENPVEILVVEVAEAEVQIDVPVRTGVRIRIKAEPVPQQEPLVRLDQALVGERPRFALAEALRVYDAYAVVREVRHRRRSGLRALRAGGRRRAPERRLPCRRCQRPRANPPAARS